MKTLVTGHLGYIGPHLTDLLRARGHDVTGVDLDLFPESEIYPHTAPDVEWKRDFLELTPEDLSGFDAVLHLAGISNDAMGMLNPALTYRINFEGTVELARAAREAGVPRFLFSSSCSVYGKTDDRPIPETGRTAPLTAYADSKIRAEEALRELASDSFSPVSLRNATAYGTSPRLRLDLVLNNLLATAYTTGVIQVLTDGSPWRPLIHCRDIARAFVHLLEAPRDRIHGEVYNVGSSTETYQVRDVANVVGRVLPGSSVTFGEGAGASDPRDYKVDFSKLNGAFPDFRLGYDLESGARELLDHFRRYEMPQDCLTGDRFIRLKTLRSKLDAGKLPQIFRLAAD
ncbi:MAG: NAD-dependent epimerase/dehydratase family protein [Thermoanaerobaculia bacterium]